MKEALQQKPTIKTPRIHFDPASGIMELTGRSIPENAYQLYMPLIEWLGQYMENPAPETVFRFKLSYFNSSSTEYILDILKRFDKLYQKRTNVRIEWYYTTDDEDMLQIGNDFKSMVSLPIELHETDEEELET